ncbi:Probable feruloyl esterase C; AltName: Full=Ferulic acid esterase C; Flags: Precursor [Serendipita indica DSM 11827]|uniref:Feruloyl esterase C n=1 Tax=Serendipita indica (strain DSM 11827) TaxID=1109443 RepID=G4TLY2_SERID|nr:Probable feruloyl esterase C; AltName: Full=Ferulic acid esterase C; Flags: Precursor [Serendipita indica DSM 11827]CCA72326.1 related to esterase D [Serendipita indica DSM 11827]
MRSFITVFLLLAAATIDGVLARSAGCGKSPPSSGTKSMTVNGKTRQYILQVPANYDPNKPYKLIFGFHWLGGNMNAVAPGYYGLRNLAGESAIFVAPNGLNNGWGNSGGEDTTFVDNMISTIENQLCVDETQRFATGWSYGGAMSYSLACSRPNVFRAVAVISGAQLSGCSPGTQPVPYLGIHGVVDSVLNISNGRQLRDKFLANNGCAAKTAPEPAPGTGTHIKTTYSCRAGYPVWWIAHSGDHVPDPHDSNGNYWAPGETWTFFTQAINGGTQSSQSQPQSSSTPRPSSTSSGNNGGNCAAKWAQCGGQGYSGPTCCQSGSTCQFSNTWYSQCL